ncbi:MAG: acetolactate synthase small subunit [Coriobacteriales bacterium]|jgi:acetolactate synthase-1/3 small subunit|nr:acetolactate synthase small subunit [Coriobacteriales bacterium]
MNEGIENVREADALPRQPRETTRRIVSLLVDNRFGVLARVASLFARKGFNIDSLTVSATHDSAISRITVTTYADDLGLKQILSQSAKLVEVRKVALLDPDSSAQRELLLVKLAVDTHLRETIPGVADTYKAEIVDIGEKSMTLEIVGKPTKIDAFVEAVSQYRVLEMCRTGATALGHGDEVLH